MPGLGRVLTETRPPRKAYVPATGERVEIPERRRVILRPAPKLRDAAALA